MSTVCNFTKTANTMKEIFIPIYAVMFTLLAVYYAHHLKQCDDSAWEKRPKMRLAGTVFVVIFLGAICPWVAYYPFGSMVASMDFLSEFGTCVIVYSFYVCFAPLAFLITKRSTTAFVTYMLIQLEVFCVVTRDFSNIGVLLGMVRIVMSSFLSFIFFYVLKGTRPTFGHIAWAILSPQILTLSIALFFGDIQGAEMPISALFGASLSVLIIYIVFKFTKLI